MSSLSPSFKSHLEKRALLISTVRNSLHCLLRQSRSAVFLFAENRPLADSLSLVVKGLDFVLTSLFSLDDPVAQGRLFEVLGGPDSNFLPLLSRPLTPRESAPSLFEEQWNSLIKSNALDPLRQFLRRAGVDDATSDPVLQQFGEPLPRFTKKNCPDLDGRLRDLIARQNSSEPKVIKPEDVRFPSALKRVIDQFTALGDYWLEREALATDLASFAASFQAEQAHIEAEMRNRPALAVLARAATQAVDFAPLITRLGRLASGEDAAPDSESDDEEPGSGSEEPSSGSEEPSSGSEEPSSGSEEPSSASEEAGSGAETTSGIGSPVAGEDVKRARKPRRSPRADAGAHEPGYRELQEQLVELQEELSCQEEMVKMRDETIATMVSKVKWESAQKEIRQLKAQLAQAESDLGKRNGDARGGRPMARKLREQLRELTKINEEQQSMLDAAGRDREEALTELDEARAELRRAKLTIAELRANGPDDFGGNNDHNNLRSRLRAAKDDCQDLRRKLDTATSDLDAANRTIECLHEKRRADLSAANHECELLQAKLDKACQDLATANRSIEGLHEDHDQELSRARNECELLQAKLDKACQDLATANHTIEGLHEDHDQEMSRATNECEALRVKLAKATRDSKSVTRKIKELREAHEAELAAKNRQCTNLKRKLAKSKADLEAAQRTMEELDVNQQSELATAHNHCASLQAKLHSTAAALAAANRRVRSLGTSPAETGGSDEEESVVGSRTGGHDRREPDDESDSSCRQCDRLKDRLVRLKVDLSHACQARHELEETLHLQHFEVDDLAAKLKRTQADLEEARSRQPLSPAGDGSDVLTTPVSIMELFRHHAPFPYGLGGRQTTSV